MKKYILLLVVILSALLISGCKSKQKFNFSFNNFSWSFSTNTNYLELNKEDSNLSNEQLNNNIIKLFKEQSNSSGYVNSIIIIEKNAPKDIQEFVQNDVEKIKNELININEINEKSFNCKSQKINLISVIGSIDMNLQQIFFSQSYFKYDGKLYIVSFSSENEEENKSLISGIKKIKCN